MPLYLADTNIIIAYGQQGERYRRIESQYNLLVPSPPALLSIVTVAEAKAFAHFREWSENRLQTIEEILNSFVVLPIRDNELVDAYAEIDVYSRKQGYDMGKNDLWIAATCCVSSATLLTMDRDFDHLHDVFLHRVWIDPMV